VTKIRIVTDSTADIPISLREELGIEMVPLKIHIGDETYLDGVTLKSEQFYEKQAAASTFPSTSQPSPVEFLEMYKKLAEAEPDVEIISIHLSSALSGTYQSAVLACSMLEEQVKVHLIDSKSASYGIGILALEAAKAARVGKSVEQITEHLHKLRDSIRIYFLVDTLEYLQKGGRIGKASALFGSLLNIKPILTVDKDGEVSALDKVRGQKKAMGRIMELLEKDFAGKSIHVHVAHSNSLEAAEQLDAQIQERFDVKSMDYLVLGPVIGAHTGTGTVAAFVYPAEHA
jgi:DegV family protein with EDD domain